MESMVLCHPDVRNKRPEAVYNEFILNDRNYTFGLLDIPSRTFPSEEIHEECVLLKKLAFSCNYRDKGTMHNMYDTCIDRSNVSSIFLAPFGSEFCAEIIKTGAKVSNFNTGDKVIPDGTYPLKEDNVKGGLPSNFASQRYEILHEKQVMKIFPEMSIETAAAFTISAQTVYSMFRKLEIKSGSKVLVLSATSNTSLAVLTLLRGYDVQVFAMTTRPEMENALLTQGADIVMASITQEGNDVREQLEREKIVFDYVVDPFFDMHLPAVLPFMNFNSRYITCGFYQQHISFTPVNASEFVSYQSILRTLMLKNISVIGNCLGTKRDLELALEDHRTGNFDILIDSVYSGGEILSFLDRTFNDPQRIGKVVYRYE